MKPKTAAPASRRPQAHTYATDEQRWRAVLRKDREADGKFSAWSNFGGNLSLDIFPARLRPLVADWIARHPASTPSSSATSTPIPRP